MDKPGSLEHRCGFRGDWTATIATGVVAVVSVFRIRSFFDCPAFSMYSLKVINGCWACAFL